MRWYLFSFGRLADHRFRPSCENPFCLREHPFGSFDLNYRLKSRPPWTKTAVCGPSICPSVHVDNGPKFVLRPSISWTNSDARPRLSFEDGRMDRFFTMDRPPHGRIRTLDQEYHFDVDEWTDFWRWTVHSMDGWGLGKFEIRVEGEF